MLSSPTRASAAKRRLECRTCQRTFHKTEHLKRHERSHTGLKPFVCQVCQRAFSRHDSLIRHDAIHVRKGDAIPPRAAPLHAPPPSALLSPVATESLASNDDENLGITESPDDSFMHTDPIEEEETEFPDVLQEALPEPDLEPDPDYRLLWPECADLLKAVVNGGTTQYSPYASPQNPPGVVGSWHRDSINGDSSPTNPMGIGNLDPFTNTLETGSRSMLTPSFLDKSLRAFFDCFLPTFPVIHRPTFNFAEYSSPLLLNAMAIGSLFVAQPGFRTNGEMLWYKGNPALEPRWQLQLAHRGPYDTCNGVQTVTTDLLSRVYGVLSGSSHIREQVQRPATGLSWATQCGMFDRESYTRIKVPAPDAPRAEKYQQWRFWVAQETQLRVLLGHFVLDDLSAQQDSGRLSPEEHTANPLDLPCSDALFHIEVASSWALAMHTQDLNRTTLQDLFSILLPSSGILCPLPLSLSSFTLHILLSGLNSLVTTCREESGPVVGATAKSDVWRALHQMHSNITQSPSITEPQRLELLFRWHTITLSSAVDLPSLAQALNYPSSSARFFSPPNNPDPSSPALDSRNLPHTKEGRTSLLHALCIHDLLTLLPSSPGSSLYVPRALTAASLVYTLFLRAGTLSLEAPTPSSIDWQDVFFTDVDPKIVLGELWVPSRSEAPREFVHGVAGGKKEGWAWRHLGAEGERIKLALREGGGGMSV